MLEDEQGKWPDWESIRPVGTYEAYGRSKETKLDRDSAGSGLLIFQPSEDRFRQIILSLSQLCSFG